MSCLELNPALELDVELVGEEVVLGVNDLLHDLELDGPLRLARGREVPLADSDTDFGDDEAGIMLYLS
jgi:hypothetical protein